jgi:hypothetical protein
MSTYLSIQDGQYHTAPASSSLPEPVHVIGPELDPLVLFVPPDLVASGLVMLGADPMSRIIFGQACGFLPPEITELRFGVVILVVGVYDLLPSADRTRRLVTARESSRAGSGV